MEADMSLRVRVPIKSKKLASDDTKSPELSAPSICPVCGAMTETQRIGKKAGWTCVVGGYAHYYQTRYGHLERWFTSGEGNLREPVIRAMNCAAPLNHRSYPTTSR
jgi:hypothetical protein